MVRLSATSLGSSDAVRALDVGHRGCLFPDEQPPGAPLQFYSEYSHHTCLFECALTLAAAKEGCTPWYLPRLANSIICDLSDEFSPTPSNDFTITGIQECGDFFDQQQQQIFTSPGRRRKRDAIPLSIIQPPLVDVFLNPLRQTEKKLVEEFMVNTTRNLFNPPLPPSSFPHLFRLLRHTSLPCLSSEHNHMLLQCIWAGEEFECGKIFTPVPTDSGMCCAFNPRTILR